jgi:hypothetical protein
MLVYRALKKETGKFFSLEEILADRRLLRWNWLPANGSSVGAKNSGADFASDIYHTLFNKLAKHYGDATNTWSRGGKLKLPLSPYISPTRNIGAIVGKVGTTGSTGWYGDGTYTNTYFDNISATESGVMTHVLIVVLSNVSKKIKVATKIGATSNFNIRESIDITAIAGTPLVAFPSPVYIRKGDYLGVYSYTNVYTSGATVMWTSSIGDVGESGNRVTLSLCSPCNSPAIYADIKKYDLPARFSEGSSLWISY